jgi:hypothetical protein
LAAWVLLEGAMPEPIGLIGTGVINLEVVRFLLASLLATYPLVSFVTTTIRPHIRDISACWPGAVILHLSLRDLTPEAILTCDNVVCNPDHVCRVQTALHLAEQATGSRSFGFIRCTLADILQGMEPPRRGCKSAPSARLGSASSTSPSANGPRIWPARPPRHSDPFVPAAPTTRVT